MHLISGHPSINAVANALFQDYQRQAARGEIQFRRWPLRAVSLLAYVFTTPYPNSHHQHKCMSLLYYVILLLFSTAPLPGKGQLLSNYFSQNSKFSPCRLESGRPTSNWYPLQPVLLTRSVTHAVLCELKSRRQRSISEVPSARPR